VVRIMVATHETIQERHAKHPWKSGTNGNEGGRIAYAPRFTCCVCNNPRRLGDTRCNWLT
jgi:hypothetical protein